MPAAFLVVENDDGLVVIAQEGTESPEETAVRAGGVLIDPAVYTSYDEAYDALELYEDQEEREE